MNLIELDRALKQLRLVGMATELETRLRQAQSQPFAPSTSSRAWCRTNWPVAVNACWSDGKNKPSSATQKTLDDFDFNFNAEAFHAIVWRLLVSHPALQLNATKWESIAPTR